MSKLNIPVWFAMRVTYRREQLAKDALSAENIQCFIPMRYQLTEKGRHKKRELVPVIHNLIFVHTTPAIIQRVKQEMPYLQYMINARVHEKIIVPDEQMRRFIAVSGTNDDQLLYFKPEELNLTKGVRVRINGGDFEGYEGVFVKVKGARDRRVVIAIKGVIAVAMATVHPDLIEVIADEESATSIQ